MQGLVCLGVPVIFGLAVWASLSWVLGPLNRAAKDRHYPIQYSIADLLCLFVLVQLPIGIVHWVASSARMESGEVICDILIGTVAILLWWNCARLLSLAGVQSVWRRCVFLTAAVPSIIVGPIAVVLLPIGALSERNLWLMLAGLFAAGVLYALGLFTRATVASAEEKS
jgi:hypothetical protein